VAGGVVSLNGEISDTTEILYLDDLESGWQEGPNLPTFLEKFTIVNAGTNGNPLIIGGYSAVPENFIFELVNNNGVEEWIERDERVKGRDNQVVTLLDANDFGCTLL